ncbi:MAG: hypothetical protein COV44_01325 [Deltaproteobacteria bacterium CG11_big_fil_rev_8_21_14_0_20_45_16]|nr:MAG: hypothetical protein COV44_01325 [Deltaproteobacteria bacterium CG11_big_fil_rev_8_21_14_0_20_45_16]
MKRLNLLLILFLFGLLACGGGSDVGNPASQPENLDDPSDGCQAPFEFVCDDDTVVQKDMTTCEFDECP